MRYLRIFYLLQEAYADTAQTTPSIIYSSLCQLPSTELVNLQSQTLPIQILGSQHT